MRRLAATAAWLMLITPGCASFPDRVYEARGFPCDELLVEHARLAADPRYAELRPEPRLAHESKVAECYLETRRPEKAEALVAPWPADAELDQHRIRARVAAQLSDEEKTKASLGALGRKRVLELAYLLDTPEFGQFGADVWFLRLVGEAWNRTRPQPLERLAERLAAQAKRRLLPLRLASADAGRPVGDLAVWTGIVRGSKIDREVRATILQLEGVDVRTDLLGITERVRRVDVEYGALVPKVDRQRIYKDAFVPNGLTFVIQQEGLNERLVGMGTVVAFGRYSGRDPASGAPVLDAYLVVEASQAERTVDDH